MIETWLPVPVPGFGDFYEVSDRGRLYSFHRSGKLMCTPPDGMGYPQVNLWANGHQKHIQVHIIVLTAFAGPCPPHMESRHLNDIKTDNRWPENLIWGTSQQNQGEDKLRNGISNRGERHGLHQLTEVEVLEIRDRFSRGEAVAALAVAYGRSRQCIGHVVSRRRWGWL